MTSGSHRILFIGLPSTGKTSYLAALWFMVNQSSVDCALKLKTLDGISKYLNEIRDAWLAYRPVKRNPSDSENQVSMLLEDRRTGNVLELTVPDLSGESYRLQWSGRQLTTSYDNHLSHASGGVFFLHPERVVKPNRIDMIEDLVQAQKDACTTAEGSQSVETLSTPWDIEKAPTQVQLVDLLQIISSREYFSRPFRIALVISAWDLLVGLNQTPEEWVSSQLPLLYQFLASNSEFFDVAIYGVSAQGGKYPSSLFSRDDFANGMLLAKRLFERTDALSTWIWEQLDESSREILSAASGKISTEEIGGCLFREFNKILTKPLIYSVENFGSVLLRQETSDSIKVRAIQMGEETIRLNRLLLEDAYPSEVSRERSIDAETMELQEKLPARRVLLVGSKVQREHDITEPLQWLMA